MRRHNRLPILLLVPLLLALSGCAGPPPVEERGTFTGEKTFEIRRNLIDVTVQTDGVGSYVVRQFPYGHPMGPPGDTECVVTTSAGTFTIENRNLSGSGVRVNGTEYDPPRPPDRGRPKMVIDKRGAVTVAPAAEPGP